MKTIHDKAMLVTLHISQWTARKYDKRVSSEAATANNAKEDAGRYNKALLSKAALADINKAVGEARSFHYEQTLPWGDSGSRILLAENYFDYMRELGKLKARFETAVDAFTPNYQNYMAEARSRLNGMFKSEDYPPADTIASKFAFAVDVTPVPQGTDFRIDLGEGEVNKIQKDIEERMQQAQQVAMKDVWHRLYDVIAKMQTRLSDPDAKFRDSLVGNAIDLISLLPRLNLTNDPELEKFRRMAETDLCKATPDALRENQTVRKNTALKAQEIMGHMAAYMGAP